MHRSASPRDAGAVELELDVAADEGMRGMLTHALQCHGLASHRVTAADPLPTSLLQACRLHAMTPAELYEHWAEPSRQVAPVSPANERHALLHARRLLAQRGLPTAAADALLSSLCAAPAEEAGPADEDGTMARLAEAHPGSRIGATRLARCEWGGRGVVSTAALGAGAVAVSVPGAALLSVAAARRCAALAPLLPLVEEGAWTETVQVMLLLLHERERGRRSPWHAWLRSLPRDLQNVGSWSEAQAGRLGGSAVYWRSHAARAELAEIRAGLLPRLRRAGASLPEHAHTAERWRWARGVIATRGLALPAPAGGSAAGALVLAPLIDMANHAEAAPLELAVDAEADALQLRAICDVASGSQLCLSYGSLGADEMLEMHGIVSAEQITPPSAEPEPEPESAGAGGGLARWPHTAAAPIRIPVSLAPCDALEEQPALLGTVMLLLSHMDLPLDGHVCAPPPPMLRGRPHRPTEPPEEAGTVDPLLLLERRLLRERRASAPVVPARLLGAARLCCLRSHDEVSRLPVSRADHAPLSAENERAGVEMLCEALAEALEALPAPPPACDAAADERSAAPTGRVGLKRPRGGQARGLDEERAQLARAFCAGQRRTLQLALAELERRQAALDECG